MSKSHTTLSLTNTKSKKRKPQKSDFTLEQKWSVVHNLLFELLDEEIQDNSSHLKERKDGHVDFECLLITAWLDRLTGYYCLAADDLKQSRKKADKQTAAEYEEYFERLCCTYYTAKYELLLAPEDKVE